MTLEDAKQQLRDNWQNGTNCPCCHQYVKLYKRKLNSSMAYGLILISKKYQVGEWFNLEEYFKSLPVPATLRGDMPKLRHWGLIEKKQGIKDDGNKNVGYYCLTVNGKAFANGERHAPERVKLYNKEFYGYDGDEITIQQALNNKFNYTELMEQ